MKPDPLCDHDRSLWRAETDGVSDNVVECPANQFRRPAYDRRFRRIVQIGSDLRCHGDLCRLSCKFGVLRDHPREVGNDEIVFLHLSIPFEAASEFESSVAS